MKIERQSNPSKYVSYRNIKQGECFEYFNPTYNKAFLLMKMFGGAVNLEDGGTWRDCCENWNVVPVTARVIVED